MDFKSPGEYLGDPVMTAAMVDRLVQHVVILSIEGPSWRMYQLKALNIELRTAPEIYNHRLRLILVAANNEQKEVP